MSFNFNKDHKRRDQILSPFRSRQPVGGCHQFKNLDLQTIKTLVEERFLDPGTQCQGPTHQVFIDFMTQYPQCKAIGYSVEHTRDDYRITIEGLECKNLEEITPELNQAFYQTFADADELYENPELRGLRCWYD